MTLCKWTLPSVTILGKTAWNLSGKAHKTVKAGISAHSKLPKCSKWWKYIWTPQPLTRSQWMLKPILLHKYLWSVELLDFSLDFLFSVVLRLYTHDEILIWLVHGKETKEALSKNVSYMFFAPPNNNPWYTILHLVAYHWTGHRFSFSWIFYFVLFQGPSNVLLLYIV